MNYNPEKNLHPENYQDDVFEEAMDIIRIIKDNLDDLDQISVRNDDLLNDEIFEIELLLDRMKEKIKHG